MAKRAISPSEEDVKRALRGALSAGIQIGEMRILRDGSIVISAVGAQPPAILDDDIDAKLEAFARK